MAISTLLILIAAVFGLSFLVFAIWIKTQIAATQQTSDTTRSLLAAALQTPILDLQERMSRQLSELKETQLERIAKSAAENQERLERALAQNRGELATGLIKTTETLQGRFQSLEAQVTERLGKIGENVEAKLNENLKEGFKHFEKVQEHLTQAELKLASLNQVGQSISDLNQLLKLPHLRGNFGESTLEKLLADFLPIGSYELQYAVVPGSTERVDAIVRTGRQILPIDSKFPREQVLPLFESQDPTQLESARKILAEIIKSEAKDIASKYIRPDHGTSDMALLFLPSETLYFEVIRNGKLFDDLAKLKVYPVSPNTLAMGLHSVSMAQDYYEMSRGVEKTIEDVKKARKHFENFEKKFEAIGEGLKKAQSAFETANTHLGRYESSVVRLVGELEDEGSQLSLPAGESNSAPSTEI